MVSIVVKKFQFAFILITFFVPVIKSVIVSSDIIGSLNISQNYAGPCYASKVILTTDSGYLLAAIVSYNINQLSQEVLLFKFDRFNEYMFKAGPFNKALELYVHRMQETETYYFLIIKARNSTSSFYIYEIYKITKLGSVLNYFSINCEHDPEIYTNTLVTILNDTFGVGACNFNSLPFSILYLYINIEEKRFDRLVNYEFQCSSSKQDKCNIVYLRDVAYNRQFQQGLFIGFATKDPATTSHDEGEGDDKESVFDWNNCDEREFIENVFSDRFDNVTSVPASSNLYDTFKEQPGCYGKTNNPGRSDKYEFLSIYNWEASSYIAMNSTNGQFDIIYSIIDDHQLWGPKSDFPKPSSIYNFGCTNVVSNHILFDSNWFLMTGYCTLNNFQIMFTSFYEKDSKMPGFIKLFPEKIPCQCNTPNDCSFKGKYLARLSNGFLVVLGSAQFGQSSKTEYLKLVYDMNNGVLVLTERKINNGEFKGTSAAFLKDNTVVIIGIDVNSLAFLKLTSTGVILQEDRQIIENDLFMYSITSSSGEDFYIGGYLNMFDCNKNRGILIKVSKNLLLKTRLIIERYFKIQKIIFSKSGSIFGIAETNNQDSELFSVNGNLEISSFNNFPLGGTILNDLTEIQNSFFGAVGSSNNLFYVCTFNSNLNLINTNSVPIHTHNKHFDNQVIIFNSITSFTFSSENYIIAAGQVNYENDNKEQCIIMKFSYQLSILEISIFGTAKIDSLLSIKQLSDTNILMIGYYATSQTFMRLYGPNLVFIKEKILSLPNVRLTSFTEMLFRKGIAVGYNLKTNQLIHYIFTLQLDCGIGYEFQNGMCVEICGDNIDLGSYQCDNSRLFCCTSSCTILSQYMVFTDPVTKSQSCIFNHEISVTPKISMEKSICTLLLRFSIDIQINSKSNSQNIEDGKLLNQISVSALNNSKSLRKLVITNISFPSSSEILLSINDIQSYIPYSKYLQIDLSKTKLYDLNGIGISTKLIQTSIDNSNLNNGLDSKIDLHILTNSLLTSTTIVATSLSLLNALFSAQGMNSIFNLLGPLQIIVLNSLINFPEYPSDIVSTFNSVAFISFNSFLPGFLENLMPKTTVNSVIDSKNMKSNAKYHPSIKSPNVFLNLQTKIVTLIAMCLAYVIANLLKFKVSIVKYVLDFLVWNGLFRTTQTLFFDYTLCSLFQLSRTESSLRWIDDFGGGISFCLLLALALYLIKIHSVLKFKTIEELKLGSTKKIIGGLYASTRLDGIAKYNILIYFLRRFFSIFLLLSIKNPIGQSISFGIITIINLIWLIRLKPEENSIIATGNILTEVVIIFIHIEMTLLAILDTSNFAYLNIVHFVVVTIQIANFIQFGFSALFSLKTLIYEFFYKKSQENDDSKVDKEMKKIVFTKDKNNNPMVLHFHQPK